MKKFFALAAVACMALGANAQKLGGSLGLETTHLWRGLEVSDGLTVDADLHFEAKGFTVGLWGGRQIDGSYKEFDYYASYSAKGFTVSLWDIYNYSADYSVNGGGTGLDIFNYKSHETNHFLDLGLAYNFGAISPCKLNLSWNTIIAGRDYDPVNDKKQLSTYVKAAYTVYENEHWTVTPSIGASLKFAGDAKSNFYGGNHKAYVNDICLNASYKLHLGQKYVMPIGATAMWTPEFKTGHLGVSVTLVNF